MITAPAVVCGTSCLRLVYPMCMGGISDTLSRENVLGAFFLSFGEIFSWKSSPNLLKANNFIRTYVHSSIAAVEATAVVVVVVAAAAVVVVAVVVVAVVVVVVGVVGVVIVPLLSNHP